jgi:hypothetical protein
VIDHATFERNGALRFERQLPPDGIEALRMLADERIGDRPGARLDGESRLATLLAASGPIGAVAASLTSSRARPVRAVLFDKTIDANWTVAWHQDRTIPVAARIDVEGFAPWSTKDGVPHVAPPFDVLARMVTLRVHLDTVDGTNAPLRIALGSHMLGRIPADQAESVAASGEQGDCYAEPGDIWAYRTPILHTSERAAKPERRRVLQVDYADFDLPGGLEWRPLKAGLDKG